MIFVTDTHPIIWYATEKHSKLSAKVTKAFQQAEQQKASIYIPNAVFLEIALLEKLERLEIQNGFRVWAEHLLENECFIHAQSNISTIFQAMNYTFNDDIFDCHVVATAKELDLPLITKDALINDSGEIEIYW